MFNLVTIIDDKGLEEYNIYLNCELNIIVNKLKRLGYIVVNIECYPNLELAQLNRTKKKLGLSQ